jgi:hypothetical protein
MELRESNRRSVTVVSKPTQDLHRPYAVFDRQVSAVTPVLHSNGMDTSVTRGTSS